MTPRILTCLLISLSASAMSQVTSTKGGYLIRLKFTKGEVTRYNVNIQQAGAGNAAIGVQMPMVQIVKSVTKGVGTLSIQVGPPNINGKPLGDATKMDGVKVDATGRAPGGKGTGGQGLTVMPMNPVKPGQSWIATTTVPSFGGQEATSQATYTFIRLTSLDGKPVAEIGTKLNSDRGGSISGSGKTYLSVADGSIVKSVLVLGFNSTDTNGKPNTMKFNVTITRK